jgi:phosphatidylserine decarboxylase
MLKYLYTRLHILIQCLLPQHLLTWVAERLANSSRPPLKHWLISDFIKRYRIDMRSAAVEDIRAYPTFNSFFVRQLKPGARSIVAGKSEIASPVDGTIAQIGNIHSNQLLQAKHFYFDLENLLGGDQALAKTFYDGHFATLYLAPANYHRVHMPLTGQLNKTIFIPGKLFSVNRMTSELIPQLYSRNERLITIFDTAAGPMAIVLVGAMIVGSIQPVWRDQPIKSAVPIIDTPKQVILEKGDELGYFKLGSTIILLYVKNRITWDVTCRSNTTIQLGELLGSVHS